MQEWQRVCRAMTGCLSIIKGLRTFKVNNFLEMNKVKDMLNALCGNNPNWPLHFTNTPRSDDKVEGRRNEKVDPFPSSDLTLIRPFNAARLYSNDIESNASARDVGDELFGGKTGAWR